MRTTQRPRHKQYLTMIGTLPCQEMIAIENDEIGIADVLSHLRGFLYGRQG